MADNVVQFPGCKKTSPPQSIDEVVENIEFFKTCHVQDSLEMIVPTLFNQLAVIGFNNFEEPDPEADKLGALIVESIRAYMCYHHSLDHSFHDLADGLFACSSEGDITLHENLKVIFQKNDEPPPDDKRKKSKSE